MEKIAVVVVTYNRKEKLKNNLRCILEQTKQPNSIYIIDNASTDGTYEYINEFINETKIKYKRMEYNSGGAGGFYEGIRLAFDDGMDYIWGMDDDAYPDKEALNKIIEIISDYSNNYCFWSNCNNDIEFSSAVKEVKDWMFVGFFIPCSIISRVGLPRKDFFIYYDDREYADRIIKSGYKIIKVRDSIIHHEDTIIREFRTKRVLGLRLRYPKLPNWKNYYYIRNNILRFRFTDIRRYQIIFYWCPMFLIKLMIIYPKQVPNFLKAYIHGILGISGARMKP